MCFARVLRSRKLVKKIAMPASTDKIVCVCYRADYAVRTEAGCHEHSEAAQGPSVGGELIP